VSFLLDTNVISEARRRRPDPKVMSWLDGVDPDLAHVSVLTFGEIAKGIAQRAHRDPTGAQLLRDWLDATRSLYADKTVLIDAEISEAWGRLAAKRTLPIVDGLLAATAIVRGMIFVTRDTRDIADTGVRTFNPWIE
jgi:predicted nucleic acid-binding protein